MYDSWPCDSLQQFMVEGEVETGAEGEVETGAKGEVETGAGGDVETGVEGEVETGAGGEATTRFNHWSVRNRIWSGDDLRTDNSLKKYSLF